MNRIIKALKDPYYAFGAILRIISPVIKNDEFYVKWEYYFDTHKKLNLDNPQSFNEKLQWLKLYDNQDKYTLLVDKYEVKKYVKDIIGEEYIIPTIGVWDSFEDIDFSKLPNQFVLKTTHDSGGVFICKDKSSLKKNILARKIKRNLSRNYYWKHRELPYKTVKPRIIAEQYMVDESGYELKDYKIFCFKGKPHFIEVDFDRFIQHRRNIYSTSWELLPFEIEYPSNPTVIHDKPVCLSEMLNIASKLSQGIPHVRVDLYVINGKIYFGELTFYHESGVAKFIPDKWNYVLGGMIKLPDHPNGLNDYGDSKKKRI